MLTPKLSLGITILLLVDVIWVCSSELTKFLYKDESYDKPFFCTYFKTSMFTIYLIVIGLIHPWKEACKNNRCNTNNNNNYSIMDQNSEDDSYSTTNNSLGDSTFIPIRTGAMSGTESDDSSIRSVRFNKLAEVREMSAHEATEALMARLSYAASVRVRRQKSHHKTARAALMFCIMWFFANYLYQMSLEFSQVAMVTVISSSSSFFTLVLAAFIPSSNGDRFTILKFLAVAFNITGVVILELAEITDSNSTRGIVLALLSALCYSAYLVFVKRKSDTEEKVDIPLFFGFVGLWNLLLLWPIFFILHFLQIETFELPNQKQFAILFINGLIGTVLSEALWLWGCFLTSSLIATLAMTVQIPLSIAIDLVLKRETYSPMFYAGSIPIFLGLTIVALLMKNDDNDPVIRFCKRSARRFCRCRPNIVSINDEEQQEFLIGDHEN